MGGAGGMTGAGAGGGGGAGRLEPQPATRAEAPATPRTAAVLRNTDRRDSLSSIWVIDPSLSSRLASNVPRRGKFLSHTLSHHPDRDFWFDSRGARSQISPCQTVGWPLFARIAPGGGRKVRAPRKHGAG